MQCWDYTSETCRGNEDRSDAVAICGQLDIPFKFLKFETEYKTTVIANFYSEYRAGRTPNPDVLCNKEIKFGLFLDWAMQEGFDYVATGHYARVVPSTGTSSAKLLKGVDHTKDQSYFLYRLTQHKLGKLLFPVGGLTKSAVRTLAKDQNLVVADKEESMGICFIGEVNMLKFLQQEIEPKQGEVLLQSTGEVVGTHSGAWFYTIGQRHGFELTKYVGLPVYVVSKNVALNQLTVGFYTDCLCGTFALVDVHFIDGSVGVKTRVDFACDVRIRHLGQLYKAQVSVAADGTAKVRLAQPAFGVAPGQSAVLYTDDEVLGGGVISLEF
jgi:tRNA-specific 2-thiouridylase